MRTAEGTVGHVTPPAERTSARPGAAQATLSRGKAWWGAVAFVAIAGIVLGIGSTFVLYEASLIAIYGVVTAGQDLLIGRAGLISLGAAAIMAVGAFTTAILSTHGIWGTFPIPLIVSGVFGAIVGLVIGIPGLRFRGLYLMLTTLALQEVISFATQEYQDNSPGHLGSGFTVTPPQWGSIQLGSPRIFFIVCAVVLGITLCILHGALAGLPGRAWSALRQSEAGAATIGVNLVRWKLWAFIGSSAITAVGGSLYAYQVGQVEYSSYSVDLGLVLIIMVFIGGIRTAVGPLLGAGTLVLLPVLLQHVASEVQPNSGIGQWLVNNEAELAYAIYGLLLLLVLIFERDGLWGLVQRLLRFGGRVMRLSQVRVRGARAEFAGVTAAEAVEAQPLGVVFANGGSQLAGQLGTTKNGLVTDLAQPLVPADDRALLSVRGLSVRYSNGSVALSGIDLDVQAGEIVAVLGRNGAGKTTLLRAIGGFLRSEHVTIAGDIRLAGVQVCGRTPTRTFRLGAVLVPEREKTFSKLTVEEHVQLVSPRGHTAEGLVFPQLAALWNSKAGLLSGGERQMLAMEMAWRSSPKLLLADEVSLGLAPVMVRTVLDRLVATVKERGVGAVIVEQDAVAALRVADRVYVVDRGGIRWSGPASGTSPAEIARTYLGGQE